MRASLLKLQAPARVSGSQRGPASFSRRYHMDKKLQQNRIVVVGRNPRDAYWFANNLMTGDLESPVLLNSAAHALAIMGAMPSHVGTIHITADAPEGENYEHVLKAIELARERNPDLKVLEAPRRVHA
jgi:hypothetical protein